MYFRFSKCTIFPVFFSVFIPTFLSAVNYEDAYSLEKQSPVFAIPLYEEVSRTGSSSDVRRTASTRLYFLYEKFNKYVPALQYQIRAGTTRNKKGEWSSFVKNLSQGLGISPYSLIAVTQACSKNTSAFSVPETKTEPNVSSEAISPEISEPYRSLSKKENLALIRLCYSVKMKTKDYEGWDHIFAYLTEKELLSKDIALPLWVGSSLQSGRGTPYRRIFLAGKSKSLSADSKSDILYLYAKFLRNRGRFEASARYFLMSSTYSNAKRGRFEAAKNLLLMDRRKEACSFPSETYNGDEETEVLFRKVCQTNDWDWAMPYLPAIRILMRENPDPIFSFVTQGGGREAAENFLSRSSAGSSDKDDDVVEEETESAGILAKLFPPEDKTRFPFWDVRDRDANLVLPEKTKYICKVIRRPFFGSPNIQPQFCKETLPGTLEQILSAVNEEEDDASYAFADSAYLPVNAKWMWKEIPPPQGIDPSVTVTDSQPIFGPVGILGPWNLDFVVFRKVLNRTYIEIRKGKEYYNVSIKPSNVLWEKG
ncbi:hypothetical protein EHO60_14500 [Leptospira fletcheri]|uniref:Tetratricopeptide repeat protein n=1 Tax=Leptospira fletcheri TaxID=2484981 RepID=A0A4R9GA18_9LEPT|nr:hypothetical protein [Leptospira fletcheri]TGK08568.1 hypothetical protein EHO60_14500 [Leptospira fletcheri]